MSENGKVLKIIKWHPRGKNSSYGKLLGDFKAKIKTDFIVAEKM